MKFKFECGFTAHSTLPYSPSARVAASTSSKTGLPVLKSSIIAPDIKGKINGYVYTTSGLEIEIEITPNNKQSEAGRFDEVTVQSPATQTVPENNFWDSLVGVSLIIGAGIIIVATIAEDIVTAGKVKVLYKDSKQYIPLLWKIQPGNVESSQATIDNLQRLINILPNELEKYPPEILQYN